MAYPNDVMAIVTKIEDLFKFGSTLKTKREELIEIISGIMGRDDDLRLRHEREKEASFSRGYTKCLRDIKERNTSYDVPLWFVSYLEATRANDIYVDKPKWFQHRKDYDTYIKYAPQFPHRIVTVDYMVDLVSKCFGLTYPGSWKDGARIILDKDALEEILFTYYPRMPHENE